MYGSSNLRQTSFAIAGMFCAKCAVTLERALARLEGIVAAQVNFATERATVVYDPARVSLAEMSDTVQGEGFDVPQRRIALNVDGLMYASSTRTVARVLEQVDGVVRATVDLKAQQIGLNVLAEKEKHADYERAIASLGLRVVEQIAPHPTREFVIRLFAIIALTALGLMSAGAHAGWFDAGREAIHAPLIVMTSAVVIAYGIGWRFYRVAFEMALLHGEFDVSVATAFVATIGLFVGLPLAIIAPKSMYAASGFILAIALTAGWFIVRGVSIWVAPQSNHPTRVQSSASQAALGIISHGTRR
jgi:Cu+-exporting ATPase